MSNDQIRQCLFLNHYLYSGELTLVSSMIANINALQQENTGAELGCLKKELCTIFQIPLPRSLKPKSFSGYLIKGEVTL